MSDEAILTAVVLVCATIFICVGLVLEHRYKMAKLQAIKPEEFTFVDKEMRGQ